MDTIARHDALCQLSPVIWIADKHVSLEEAPSMLLYTDLPVIRSFIKIDDLIPVFVTDCILDGDDILNVVKDVIRTPASVLHRNTKRLYILLNVDAMSMNDQKALRLLIDNSGSCFGCLMTTLRLNHIDKGLQSRSLVMTSRLREKYRFENTIHQKVIPSSNDEYCIVHTTYASHEEISNAASIDHRLAQAKSFIARHDCLAVNHTTDVSKHRHIKDLERSLIKCKYKSIYDN
jgi:hypothetical protein